MLHRHDGVVHCSTIYSFLFSLINQSFVTVSTFCGERQLFAFLHKINFTVEQSLQVVPYTKELQAHWRTVVKSHEYVHIAVRPFLAT